MTAVPAEPSPPEPVPPTSPTTGPHEGYVGETASWSELPLFTDPRTVRLMVTMSESALWYFHQHYGAAWVETFLTTEGGQVSSPPAGEHDERLTPEQVAVKVWQDATATTADLAAAHSSTSGEFSTDPVTALVLTTFSSHPELGNFPSLPGVTFAGPSPSDTGVPQGKVYISEVTDMVTLTPEGAVDFTATDPVTAVQLLDRVFLCSVTEAWASLHPNGAKRGPQFAAAAAVTTFDDADVDGAAGWSATSHTTVVAVTIVVTVAAMMVVLPTVGTVEIAWAVLVGLLVGTVGNAWVRHRRLRRQPSGVVRRTRKVVKGSPRLQHIASTHQRFR